MLSENLKNKLITAQKNEITEYFIYKKLISFLKNKEHKNILEKISKEELLHFEFFKKITKKEIKPNNLKILFYVFISRFFGLNFGLRLMEKGEDLAQVIYEKIKTEYPEIEKIIKDEKEHELRLLDLIDEEKLKYIGSVALGLNDALVELTGALAGFTLALQNSKLITIAGLVTGISASLSMASSEYLSTKQEETKKSPLRASIYTGFTYLITVIFLIFPYFIFKNIFLCLLFSVFNAIFLIFLFVFYISVAKELNFKKRFLEMVFISLTIAMINFFIGLIIRKVLNIEI